jgi:hypothetical protein
MLLDHSSLSLRSGQLVERPLLGASNLDQSGGFLRVQGSIQSQKQTLLLSCLSASRTDFDHRSLEGILLIVVQCKHAALSRGHSNDVTSVYGTCAILVPPALASARQRNGRETRMKE